jgi:uncharacterized protein YbjT (DUF2867 family)
MSDYTVTVVGATGKTGRHVAEQAVARGWRVRAAGRRAARHGEWAMLDWDDEDTWRPAFSGSDAAYVLTPFNHPGAPERTPHLLGVAASIGVSRIVLLSSLDADSAAEDSPLRLAERTLQALPVHSAIVRPTWFLDNFTVGSFATMTWAGDLRLPAGNGTIPFVDVRDVAAVAVAALAPSGPQGVLPVTGPEQLSHDQVAAALAAAFGRPITYTDVDSEEFIGLLMARGFSRGYGQFLADALREVAEGRLLIPASDTVERLTGRRPHDVIDFASYHAAHLAVP